MDNQNQPLNGHSQRRRLIKKPPSHYYSRSSSGLDGFDSTSLHSQRSSQSLRRTPSAPGTRSNTSNPSVSVAASSNSPSPRHTPVTQRSNASPLVPQGDFTPAHSNSHLSHTSLPYHTSPPPAQQQYYAHSPQQHPGPLPEARDELIGAPFDGASILNRLEQPTSPPALHPQHSQPHIRRHNVPAPLAKFGVSTPGLRSSRSYNTMESAAYSDKPMVSQSSDYSGITSPKRFSDDGKDSKSGKPPMLRKKSGFSGFVNSLVGSQKKVAISAPENPVHVTHVGYDSSTGQFTVSGGQLFSAVSG